MSDTTGVPVVFIHGLWMHATSWDGWVGLFNDHGYRAMAPGWPGESATAAATRARPGGLANRGIAEVTNHYSKIIADLPVPPIVIGHSVGGLIAQRLLSLEFARGCVAVAPARFRGVLRVPVTQLATAWPVLRRPWLRTRTWSHTPDTFHRDVANGVTRVESDRIFAAYGIPAPARPLFQAALANLTPRSAATVDTRRERGPLLLAAGGIDRTVPESAVRAAYRIQRRNPGVTEFRRFEGRGHCLAVDGGWHDVAGAALEFLSRTVAARDTASS
ncbi:MAG TPA: alpha/beta hydrolase [Asanoa sp.]|nr:alpha/beta hydrolase [Asanoa sp.]